MFCNTGGSDEFSCANGQCVNSTNMCDGFDDCMDNSDERCGKSWQYTYGHKTYKQNTKCKKQCLTFSNYTGVAAVISAWFFSDAGCLRSVKGEDYTGNVSVTITGKTCLMWSKIKVDYTGRTAFIFPDVDSEVS